MLHLFQPHICFDHPRARPRARPRERKFSQSVSIIGADHRLSTYLHLFTFIYTYLHLYPPVERSLARPTFGASDLRASLVLGRLELGASSMLGAFAAASLAT